MSTSREPDARRHPRFSVDVEVTVIRAGGRRVGARTRDLSRTGICLICSEAVASGTAVTLNLVLAFGQSAFSEPLTLSARVVWCSNIAGSYQVGAMFDDLTDQQDSFLEMFLRFLDGTLSPGGFGVAPGRDAEVDDSESAAPARPYDKDDPFRK
jgi:PilZ domain